MQIFSLLKNNIYNYRDNIHNPVEEIKTKHEMHTEYFFFSKTKNKQTTKEVAAPNQDVEDFKLRS